MSTTTDEFLEDVKRLCTMPANQVLDTDLDILRIGDQKIKDTIIPALDRLKQEFFVATPLDYDLVVDQTRIKVPARSYGRKIRECKLIGTGDPETVWDFPQIALEREQFYQPDGTPFGFRFQADWIYFVPRITVTGYSLRVWYYLGPSKLVPMTSCGVIASISGDDVTLVSTPPTTFVTDAQVDFIDQNGMNQCLLIDKPIVAVAGNTLTFAADTLTDDISVGDTIALKGQSCYVQIPDLAVPYLRTATSAELLHSISDFEGSRELQKLADMELKNLLSSISPRVDGEPTILMNQNGFLRRPYRGIGVRRGF